MAAPRDKGHAAIKLFGRIIPLLDTAAAEHRVVTKLTNDVKANDVIPCAPDKPFRVEATSFGSKSSEDNGLQSISRHCGKVETDSKSEETKTESDGSYQEKELKKPDKILPCPRCNSMETKFCYFNNYNVNQPRHFCRNCQRYWTAGGNIRNVPVGSGRRRNKQASHYHHAMMPCSNILAAHGDVPDVIHQLGLPGVPPVLPEAIKENETATKFGSEVPVCKSTASSVLNAGEQKNTDLVPLASGDNKEEQSCSSSAAVSGCSETQIPDDTAKGEPNVMSGPRSGMTLSHSHVQYPTGPALVFPWSPGWNNVAVTAATQRSTEPVHGLENAKPSLPLWVPSSMMAAPGFGAPVLPFPLVPPFWTCVTGWPDGMSGSPWPGCNGAPNESACLRSNSPTLGKHSREGNLQEEEKTQRNLWAPKTLRIDDPAEAAKSSIWDTLGIKPDEKGMFKSFQSKVLKNDKTPESPRALQANPAAFSRSQSFQEKT